ncbi:MAG: S8 family serine peptidase [Actinomycetota bacterium]|nr:S8 family serine peptidase [Actinomycetota bacterium]
MSLPTSRRRGRTVAVAVALGMVLPAMAGTTTTATADDGPAEDALEGVTAVVVKLAGSQTIEEINARYGTTVVDQVTPIRTYLLEPPPTTTPTRLVEDLESDLQLQLEWVEPNFADGQPEGSPTYRWDNGSPVVVGSDPAAWRSQQALSTIRGAEAHQTTRGEGTVVAVLDTGVHLGHPGLSDRFTTDGYDFVDDDFVPEETRNGVDDDADGRIDEGWGHGTHVAGVVSAVAPDARIMPLRVLDDEGLGFVWTTAEAIRWASARGADVINLSLGTAADSALLEDAVEDAEEDGAVVVAAAGNENRSQPQWPAADDDAVGVGSVSPADVRSPFSNHGSWVDVAAPGQDIVSTFPAQVYARWDGTSMATPFVSGQAALLRARRPAVEVEQLIRRIRRTAVPVGAGLGGGRIDLAASLRGW